jgi:uncharacterized ParB-like nuclease family protein
MPERNLLKIDVIRTDGATQPRAAIDFEAVFDYMDAMSDGAEFPPVVVFYDGTSYWLADGFHRVKAAEQAGFEEIACELHQGTQQEAQWYSFGANKTNGLRRTNDDKQRAVRAALAHPKGVGLSDRQISSHVGVDHKTVGAWREKLEGTGEIPQSGQRTGRDGRTTNIAGNRRHPEAEPKSPATAEPTRAACATCGEAFAEPVWHCATCGHHWPMSQAQCGNCQQDHPIDSAPSSEPPGTTPDTREDLVWECCQRVCRAAAVIAECGLAAKDLAAAIRRSNSSNELSTQLERTRDFIASILAEAGID